MKRIILSFSLSLLCILLMTGCEMPLPSSPAPPPPVMTPERKLNTAKIKQQLPFIYSKLLKASQALCKQNNCNYPLEILENDKQANAYADGKKVYITEPMIDIFDNKEEVAVILSHEIAHNIMEHISAKQQNQLLGLVLDMAAAAGGVDTRGTFSDIGASAYSQNFELEADYVGLYIMARADYPITNAAFVWRKMAKQFPQNIRGNLMSTHPSSAKRFLTLEKTAEEINRKKRLKHPLIPEFIKEK